MDFFALLMLGMGAEGEWCDGDDANTLQDCRGGGRVGGQRPTCTRGIPQCSGVTIYGYPKDFELKVRYLAGFQFEILPL
jgi:hypothetical protein